MRTIGGYRGYREAVDAAKVSDNATVEASGNATIKAWDNTTVMASGKEGTNGGPK